MSKKARLSDEDLGLDSDAQCQSEEEQEDQEDQVTESFDPDDFYATTGDYELC